jgi:succinate dehydrogenase / fumarate reductase, cytochrome b subunit
LETAIFMGTTIVKAGQPGSKAWFKDSFVLHKLHSLSGVFPIGFFLIFHLVINSYALRGEVEFNTAARAISYLPFIWALEWALIFIPIIFHSVYGFMITAEMRANTGTYQYGRNWLYLWQRISGVVALVYIIYHVIDTWGAKKLWESRGGDELGHQAISYAAMAWRFADWWYLAIYVIGISMAAFHLGNGLFNFAIRWGIAIGKEAQKVTAVLGWAVFIGLTGIGIWTAAKYALVAQNYEGLPIRAKYPTMELLIKDKVEEEKAHKAAEKVARSARGS